MEIENNRTEIPKEVENEYSVGKKESYTKKFRQNPWIVSTLVLGILSLILIVGGFSGGITGNVVSGDSAGENLITYLNTVADSEVTLVEVNDNGAMYEVIIEYQGQEMPIYVTKDGENYAPSLVPLVQQNTPSSSTPEPVNVPKSDKPEVELFVMTHCPYGTQAEKGIIPTIKALGDTADVKIRFVHYFMHDPEETETPIQVCIREEQPDKWLNYLECFLEDGDSDRCLTSVGIDKAKMQSCISSGKADDYYAEDSALSESYGVGGSPSLVINGVQASSGRDSASYLKTICSAFNSEPSACSQVLSSASPSPGFGTGTASASTSAQC